MSLALTAFCGGMTPSSELPIDKWIESELTIPHSIKSPQIDYDLTPQLRDPVKAMADDETRELTVMAPTGSGKTTTIMEACTGWVISESPANMAVVFHKEKAINKWRDTRLMPMLRASKGTRNLVPPDRSAKNKKGLIQFPSMWLQTIFAAPSQLQSDTIKIMLCDEVWAWGPEMLTELRARNHGQFDYKLFIVSQGGFEGDQLDTSFNNGEIHDWSFECPSCKKYQKFQWKQVKGWVETDKKTGKRKSVKNKAGEWDWKRIGKNCRYECGTKGCKKVWKDNPIARRSMHKNAKYISRKNNHLPNRVSYHFNAIAVWWIPLFELVQQWIVAQEALKMGNKELLAKFIQKRLAETWEDISDVPVMKMGDETYSMSDFANGEKWEHETHRFLTFDVQGDHFWVVVRLWSVEHGSRGVYAERVETWEGIRIVQKRFNIPNKGVFGDRGFRPDEVGTESHKSKSSIDPKPWIPLLGDKSKGYEIRNRRTKRVETHAISGVKTAVTNAGLSYKYIKYSNLMNKDCLTGLMSVGKFGVGVDHSPTYKTQMESEHKVRKPSGVILYELIKQHYQNHLWDCEVMQCVAATIYGLLKTSTDAGVE